MSNEGRDLHVNIGVPTTDHKINVIAVAIVECGHEELKLLLIHEQVELAAVPGLRSTGAKWHGDVGRGYTWLVVSPVVVERPGLGDSRNRRSLGRALIPLLTIPAAGSRGRAEAA
jgi:hypothetical protein